MSVCLTVRSLHAGGVCGLLSFRHWSNIMTNATLLAAWADSKIGIPGDGATTEDPRDLCLLDAVWEATADTDTEIEEVSP